MPVTVKFKFKPGDFVNTPIGLVGYVSFCNYDTVGDCSYYVVSKDCAQYWNDHELTISEDGKK